MNLQGKDNLVKWRKPAFFLSITAMLVGLLFIFKSLAFFGINFLCVYKSVSQKHNSTIKGFCYITGPVVYEFIICITSDLWILE